MEQHIQQCRTTINRVDYTKNDERSMQIPTKK